MARPVIKSKKQPPPKKMSPKEQKAFSKRTSAAIQGKRPSIKSHTLTEVADLPKPTVFYDCHRKIHLLVETGEKVNRYLIMGDEQIEVIKLKHASPVRNEKGFLPDETTSVSDLTEYEYDLKKAANTFYKSLLAKSPEAVRELCKILGKAVPEVTEEEKSKRMAKVERMKKVREVLIISRKEKASEGEHAIMTASGFPTSAAIVTILPAVLGGSLDSARSEIMDILKKAGGHQTVSELRKAAGKPVGVSVMKLVDLGLVALS